MREPCLMDILATPLLKALVVDDLEAAIDLGALELEEEDIALVHVCLSRKNTSMGLIFERC